MEPRMTQDQPRPETDCREASALAQALADRCRELGVHAWSLVNGTEIGYPPAEAGLRMLAREAASRMQPGAAIDPIHVESRGWILLARLELSHERGRATATAMAWWPEASATREHATERQGALQKLANDVVEKHETERTLDAFARQMSDCYDTIDVLYTIGRSMRAPSEPGAFLSFLCERLHRTMSFGFVLARFGDASGMPKGLRDGLWWAGDLPRGEEVIRRATQTLLAEVDEAAGGSMLSAVVAPPPGLRTPGSSQLLVQPLGCKGRMVGLLIAGNKRGPDSMVSSYDSQLIEAAAGYVGAFADNVALYEDQEALFLGTVRALTAAIDAKDRYTLGHSERVAHLSVMLARSAGLSRADEERLHLTGLVHDVGKIGVPERVLLKPGKLTEEEFALIRLHPEIGHRILKDIPQLAAVLPGVLHHHERYDGKGYPHGLKSTQIPTDARVIAVADTFDAMSSDRSYRPRLPRDQVIAEIIRHAGTQFDPDLAHLIARIDLNEYDRMVALHQLERPALLQTDTKAA
jgi:HD-GYP domain-containing protein (c-di-GMP phosphodiesterase class II)